MKKIIFIDRDGTIIVEPEGFQIDSYAKFRFLPNVISALKKISLETDFDLVMVTNQDGLGTSSFPEKTFWPVQNLMLEILASEGIDFSDICIDRSFPNEKAKTRKPNTGMLEKYLNEKYDLANSFVIGDRKTDVQLAKNLGCSAIQISGRKNKDCVLTTMDWNEIADFLTYQPRISSVHRKTAETDIAITLNLDGSGISKIKSKIGFLNHMLTLLAKHAKFDLNVQIKGDLEVDKHHTVEDTAIVLGQAFSKALADKRGVERYGFFLPMDESRAEVSLDLGGRFYLKWDAKFKREKIGEMPTELFRHFFYSFAEHASCNLYIKARGKNEHHKIEAIFKAFARSLKNAVIRDNFDRSIPSTKGML